MTTLPPQPQNLAIRKGAVLPGKVYGTPLMIPKTNLVVVRCANPAFKTSSGEDSCEIRAYDLTAAPAAAVNLDQTSIPELPLLWFVRGDYFSGILHDQGKLFATAGNRLYHLDIEAGVVAGQLQGAAVWQQITFDAPLLPPVQHDQFVYVVETTGKVSKIRKLNGKIFQARQWSSKGEVREPPMILDGKLIYRQGNIFYGLNPDTLAQDWASEVRSIYSDKTGDVDLIGLAKPDWSADFGQAASTTPPLLFNGMLLNHIPTAWNKMLFKFLTGIRGVPTHNPGIWNHGMESAIFPVYAVRSDGKSTLLPFRAVDYRRGSQAPFVSRLIIDTWHVSNDGTLLLCLLHAEAKAPVGHRARHQWPVGYGDFMLKGETHLLLVRLYPNHGIEIIHAPFDYQPVSPGSAAASAPLPRWMATDPVDPDPTTVWLTGPSEISRIKFTFPQGFLNHKVLQTYKTPSRSAVASQPVFFQQSRCILVLQTNTGTGNPGHWLVAVQT